jgi:tripartite-type tricarboxylate transporter receptor subunit TctC
MAQRALMTAGSILGAVFLMMAMASPLGAQSYPNKPIRFILPQAPGGVHDILGRLIGQKLAARLGQPVVPENRGGSGGNVGTEVVAKARPDGYTIVLVSSALAISPSLYKKLTYDPIKDLTPISLVSEVPVAVLVHPSSPFRSLGELVEYAKTNPGKLNFGSGGIGSANHLSVQLFKSLAKINIVHVPYKGTAPAMIGLMGGEIQMAVSGIAGMIPQIQTGKLRPLAVLSNERLPSLPNVPTAKEAGIDNYVATTWYGILGPAGISGDIVSRLNAEWVKTAAMPDTKEKMQMALEAEPLSSTPEQFGEFIKSETVRWAKVIKDAHIPTFD